LPRPSPHHSRLLVRVTEGVLCLFVHAFACTVL
jgi:hypothetical protein